MNNEAAVNRKIRTQNRSKLRTTVQIGMLGAIALVLMFFEFPIPFIAPPFIKMDFNFIIGCAFVVPAGLFYRKKKTRVNALKGMAAGTLLMAAMGCLTNAFIMFPLYSTLMGIPMDSFIAMGTAIHPAIDNMVSFVILCMVPFNLLKGIVISFITLLLPCFSIRDCGYC